GEDAGFRHCLGNRLCEQLLLRSEVAIDHHRRYASALRNFPHANAVITCPREGEARRIEDRSTSGGGVSSARRNRVFTLFLFYHNSTDVDFSPLFKYTGVDMA